MAPRSTARPASVQGRESLHVGRTQPVRGEKRIVDEQRDGPSAVVDEQVVLEVFVHEVLIDLVDRFS
jgi:hypothetical protein